MNDMVNYIFFTIYVEIKNPLESATVLNIKK